MNEIIGFLQKNVLKKQINTDERIYFLEKNRMKGVYSDRMYFSDLVFSENRFRFNMTTVTNEQLYHIDRDGNLLDLGKDYTGTSVFCYEIARRRSTSSLTGYMHCLSSSVTGHTMEAVVYGVYQVRLENNELKWKEQQLLYRDMTTGDGHYRPVAFDSDVRFYLENGKTCFEYIPRYYDVDPETLSRTLSRDQYPCFVSGEK